MITQVENIVRKYNFSQWNLVELKKPISIGIYKNWLEKSFHGDMEYLSSHLAKKESPKLLLPKAHSALVFAQNYYPHPKPLPLDFPLRHLKMAAYAQGQDYHHWFQDQLQQVSLQLKAEFPDHDFMPMTDSSPVLERDLAYQAGLGWVGKNSCLIHSQHGSLFFIGEIYTTLQFKIAHTPHPDRCGTCTRCIDACPTQALLENRTMDATKCISYLNIESKKNPLKKIRPFISDWFFGCDICQSVCPWNEKNLKLSSHPNPPSTAENILEELSWVLQSSNKQLLKSLRGTPLSRAGAVGLKRNAIIVGANLNFSQLTPLIERYTSHERLGELSQWALQKLNATS